MVDRNYQLVQQAAAVLPPDELIARLVHKLNLSEYLKSVTTFSTNCVYFNVLFIVLYL